MSGATVLEARGVGQRFGPVVALEGVDLSVRAGEVLCLLGDNGAGKSTLIAILSGVERPAEGELLLDGEPLALRSPRDARHRGIATVFQDLALVALLGVSRNFFLGREPTRGRGPLRRLDLRRADRVAREQMARIGIELRDPTRPVSTLSGGERQCLAIARAVYFGARVLILDEPTAALGVAQAAMVLREVSRARERGVAVLLVTHNAAHAHAVGDRFEILERGRNAGSLEKSELTREALLERMTGGREPAER